MSATTGAFAIERKIVPGRCDWEQKPKDAVYCVSANGEVLTLCWPCVRRLLDLRLLQAGRVEAAGSVARET